MADITFSLKFDKVIYDSATAYVKRHAKLETNEEAETALKEKVFNLMKSLAREQTTYAHNVANPPDISTIDSAELKTI